MHNLKLLQDTLLKTIEVFTPLEGRRHPIRPALREAFYRFPRHEFVERFKYPGEAWRQPIVKGAPDFLPGAYQNQPLMYLDENDQMLQACCSVPEFIFHLAELLDVRPGHRVLEIGCGTGWLVSLFSYLVGDEGSVVGVEINPRLAAQAEANIQRLGVRNVSVITGDGFAACGAEPFDRVIVTAAVHEIPHKLITLLREGGLAMIPIRNRSLAEEAHLLRRQGAALISELNRPCRFVPMAGDAGANGAVISRLDQDPVFQALSDHKTGEAPLTFGETHVREMFRHSYPFTSFLSKVEPRFKSYILEGFSSKDLAAAMFGDADVYGFGLIDRAEPSAAIWRRGMVSSYGTPAAARDLHAWARRWDALGRPSGFAFDLTIAGRDEPPATEDGAYREDRREVTLWWRLREPDLRR